MTTAEKRTLADLVIVPDVRAFNPLNFGVAQPLIDAGYAAAKAALAGVSVPGLPPAPPIRREPTRQ